MRTGHWYFLIALRTTGLGGSPTPFLCSPDLWMRVEGGKHSQIGQGGHPGKPCWLKGHWLLLVLQLGAPPPNWPVHRSHPLVWFSLLVMRSSRFSEFQNPISFSLPLFSVVMDHTLPPLSMIIKLGSLGPAPEFLLDLMLVGIYLFIDSTNIHCSRPDTGNLFGTWPMPGREVTRFEVPHWSPEITVPSLS